PVGRDCMETNAGAGQKAIVQLLQLVILSRKNAIDEPVLADVAVVADRSQKRVRGGGAQLIIRRIKLSRIDHPVVLSSFSCGVETEANVSGFAVAAGKSKAKIAATRPAFENPRMQRFFVSHLVSGRAHGGDVGSWNGLHALCGCYQNVRVLR